MVNDDEFTNMSFEERRSLTFIVGEQVGWAWSQNIKLVIFILKESTSCKEE